MHGRDGGRSWPVGTAGNNCLVCGQPFVSDCRETGDDCVVPANRWVCTTCLDSLGGSWRHEVREWLPAPEIIAGITGATALVKIVDKN